jgi:AcrR family transcriptional regulator
MPSAPSVGSTPTPVGRRERKAAETRERIFHAAIELFARRGLSNVTVEQITERADVGKGTFFNYFNSKEDVLAYFGALQVERLEQARTGGEISGTPREQILQILHLLATHPALTSDLARAMLVAHLHLGTAARQHAPSVWQVASVIAESVRAGQREGSFVAHQDAEDMALWVLGQFFLAQLTCCTGYAEEPFPELAHRYISRALDALSVEAPEPATA